MKRYTRKDFTTREENTRHAARTVFSIIQNQLPDILSVVDVGCGSGAWLAVLREMGVETILGLDGHWVDADLLAIPEGSFMKVDLKEKIQLTRRFDLAISLEVAEHLPPDKATEFIHSLTDMSDLVLFSAAIPFQGGKNHLNEQWQSIWVKEFAERNYQALDLIRPVIWNEPGIHYWYKQNMFLFYRKDRPLKLKNGSVASQLSLPVDIIHPDLYLAKSTPSLKNGLKHLRRAFRNWTRSFLPTGSSNTDSKRPI